MVENNLTREIRAFITQALEDFAFSTPKGETLHAPQVINGYLPPKRSNGSEDFPFVIVRPERGTVEQGETLISVLLLIGCYSEEFDGYEYCMNVFSRLRNAFTMMPCQTLAGRFQLDFPIKWTMNADQPYPQWQIDVTTQWKTMTPEIHCDIEEETYGYFKKQEEI